MKRIHRSCVAALLLLAMLLSCVPALAAGSSHSYTTLQKAEALKTLGIFQGTKKGFELEGTLTREQAVTLIVRLLGAEAEAKEKNPEHPFTDVWAWASPYVGYGYQNNLVKGMGGTTFGYGQLVTEAQFLTMLLRVLQYEDGTDFTWSKSAELAGELGLPVVGSERDYTRGNAVDVIWELLKLTFKSGKQTLAEMLIEKGVFTEKAYRDLLDEEKNGSKPSKPSTPVTPEPVPDPEPEPEEPTEQAIYVSPNGGSDGDGSKDAPFGSLEAVRDYLRENRSTELPTTVYLRGGTYVLNKTFELTEADGGTEELPVTWRAYPGEAVTITGSAGASLSAFEPVSGEMKDKLSPDAQEHVVVASLSDLGLGTINVGLSDINFCIDAPLFSLDGQHMRLTRYPNSNLTEDWMHVETVDPTQATDSYPKFKMTDETVLGWDYSESDRIYASYISYGWALHYFHGMLDKETGIVTSTDTVHYGSSSGLKPTQLYNAYESLDEPGEWYYDQTSGKLYIYPFANTTAASTLRMTSGNFDLISVKNASYLNLEGLTVTSSKKNGIVMDGVDHCVIDNCTLTDFEERAISIDNATNSGIQNSEIAYTSVTAIYLNGGDHMTMTPGYNFITGCRIHDTNQYRVFNEGGVKFRGVKNTFSNNEVYNITDMALNFAIVGDAATSLDCVIENNAFHDVILNGKDLGAVYGGRDARCQGMIIRNNHFYNLSNNDASYPSFSANAVYLDDGLSGATITGNIFGPGASGSYVEAVKINCGHDTVITNNLFIDTRCVFNAYIDSRFVTGMTSDSGYGIASSLRQVWNNELYTSRWPWMAALRDGETDVYIPNILKNNIIIYTNTAPRGSETSAYPWVKTNDNQESKITGLDNNLVILKGTGDNRQLFADYANGNYALIDSVLAQLPGFEQIDQSKIGVKSFPGNQKPAASGVSVSGTAEIGQTLNAVYTFSDADGDSEGATVVNFYISENQNELFYLNWKKVSDNMTRTEFTVTPICEGKWIRCKLTPVDSRGAQGEPVWSEPVFVAFTSTVDKTEFRALVNEAKAKVEAAQIGDEPGQWTQKEIDLITAAIADSEAVLAKDPISQYDFDLGVAAFQKAYTRFCNNQNAGTATDVIEIDALIEDTENWTPYSGNKEGKPTFVGGKLTLNATSAYQTSCYTGRTYSNKTFLFNYQQTYAESNDSWSGFYFNMGDAEALPYSQKCILVVAKADQTELQIYDGANPLVMKVSKFAFESGKTYRVEFGLYDVNSTDVRAVLTVDGKEILSYEAENEYLHSAKGRFGVVAAPNGMDVTLGSVGTKLTIDSLIDDETNWKTITNTFAPKFIASKMLLNGKSYTGYAGEKFTNRVLHFKYRLTFSEDAAAAGEWGGLYFNAGGADVYPWTGTGILACIKSDVIELQVYEDGTRTKFLTNTENLLDSSKTYRMTFGMYDVNSTDVRIVMTADDVTLFDETITSAKLHSLAGYFGASASDFGVLAQLGSLGNKINVSTLVRSEGSWKTYTGNAPEFKDGSLSITSSEASYELAAFADEKFSSKVFNFKYKQVIPEGADTWGGFYFNKSDPVAMPWGDKGVLVVIKPYQVELQRYGDESGILKIATGEFFRSDMIYDVSFGIVDVNSTDVRIFVTVDGKTLFDETITDATLHGASGYFGAIAPAGGVQVTLNDLSGNDKHYNNLTELPLDAMIADKANWTDFSWAHFTTKPVFGDGTVSVTSTTEGYATLAGYSKEKYRNTEFQFKYQQRAAANDDGNYGLVIWTFDSNVTNLTWNSGGVMVAFEHGKTVLYAYGDAQNVPVAKSDLALEDGRTYDMTFSVCQISANQLRVVLKVDGEEWFNEVYTDAMLANTAGYFNVGACRDASATIEKTGKVVVPEPDPEPSYKVVDVTDMLADTANWTLGYDAPTFAPGSITAKTADGFSVGGYNTPVELDTVYRFKYKNVRATGWYDGFYLGFKPANIYWADGGVQVDFNDDSTVLHCFNGSQAVLETTQSPSIESGKEYEIEFGLLKAGDDTVKVYLKINGTPYFADVEVKNSVFVTTPLYFGIFSRGSEATISTMEDGPHYMLVDVTKMLADTSNWTMGYDAPTFAEGSITAKTADGFSIGGYNTPVELGTVYRFKYKNVRATGWYDGFYLGFKPANIYWADGGVQVDFNDDSTVLHCFNGSQAVLETTQSPSIESGKEYEIEFGLLKAGDDTVKVYLKINGTPYFADVEVKNSVFVTTPLYFGIFSRGSEATISTPNAK